MPTYFRTDRFIKDLEGLSEDAKQNFREAVQKFVEDLKRDGIMRTSLGIRAIRSRPGSGIMEFHFEGDGRATFQYGTSKIEGEAHVIWRRVGTHAVYNAP